MAWIAQLKRTDRDGGDPIEREGIIDHRLGEIFPRYAEFWGKYVYPNRDRDDPSKLKKDLPLEIEAIYNNHYYVFYQFVVSLRQISNLSNPLLDIADPLLHLGTAIDQIERTFISLFAVVCELERKPLYRELTDEEYKEHMNDFWPKSYQKAFKKFQRNYRPVNITLHNVSSIFGQGSLEIAYKTEFNTIVGDIRRYRNLLAHSLPPLRVIDPSSGMRKLPKLDFLEHYLEGNWSSSRYEIILEHYASADEILGDLARKLIICTNQTWETTLNLMSKIATHPKYKDVVLERGFPSSDTGLFIDFAIPVSASGDFEFPSEKPKELYVGGTADFVPYVKPTGLFPTADPSGETSIPKITPSSDDHN